MKTILALVCLISSSAFAQSIVLEDKADYYDSATMKYVMAEGTGAAGIQVGYNYNDSESVGDTYNFTFKGLSYDKQTEEVVFDNGINQYVCARYEHKRFIFKYKVLISTGNCKLSNKVYGRNVVTTDGVHTRTEKVTYRKLMFVVENSDRVEITNWNVQKWSLNN